MGPRVGDDGIRACSAPARLAPGPGPCRLPFSPSGADDSPECHEAGVGLPHQSPIRGLTAQPPHTGLVTSLPPWLRAPSNRYQAAGSVERALHPGWPRGGRPQDLELAPERGGSGRTRAYLGGAGAGGSVQGDGGQEARWPGGPAPLTAEAGRQRPGHLGDDIGAVWPAWSLGQAGAEHGPEPWAGG